MKLQQIQDSANFFRQAREKFHVIKQNKDSLQTPEEIQQSFSGLCSCLRAAEEMLIMPQLPNVQDLYTAEQRVGSSSDPCFLLSACMNCSSRCS